MDARAQATICRTHLASVRADWLARLVLANTSTLVVVLVSCMRTQAVLEDIEHGGELLLGEVSGQRSDRLHNCDDRAHIGLVCVDGSE